MNNPGPSVRELFSHVNCFKEGRYRWFELPRPMSYGDAVAWAERELDMPVEAFRHAPSSTP